MSGVVYFMRREDGGPVKIGWASSPDHAEQRRKTCQTGHSAPLRIVRMFPGSMDDEKALHAELARYRMSGEWFMCVGPVVEHAVGYSPEAWACYMGDERFRSLTLELPESWVMPRGYTLTGIARWSGRSTEWHVMEAWMRHLDKLAESDATALALDLY